MKNAGQKSLWLALCALGWATSAAAQTPAPVKPPEQRGALAPATLAKPRPKPPFDLTGTWFVDLSGGLSFRFGPPYPKFKPAAQAELDAGLKAPAEGHAYKDYIR